MKRRMRVTEGRARRRKPARGSISLAASAESKRARPAMGDVLGLYKPRKKPITLHLDADVLDWFKKAGRGYQTRINRALRMVMLEEE